MTLLELIRLLRKSMVFVVALPLAVALAAGVFAYVFMADVYASSTSMYVLTKAAKGSGEGMSNAELSASQMLANDIATLIKSDRVMGDTANDLGMQSLDDYKVSVASEATTRVITLSVEGEDAQAAAAIANELAENVSAVAQEVMDVRSVNVIDEAKVANAPSGPKRLMYVVAAFMAGLFLAVAIVVLKDRLNTRVRSAEDIEELLGLPVIGRIPTIKGGVL